MKIEKYKKYIETYEGDGGDDYPVESDYTVSSIQDRIFIKTLVKDSYLVITIEPKDILKQMTWLVGQEEHKLQEKIHESRDGSEDTRALETNAGGKKVDRKPLTKEEWGLIHKHFPDDESGSDWDGVNPTHRRILVKLLKCL